MTYYAFIVGANQDWPEQRCSLGDIGVARCLSEHCHLPKENLAELYDERATRSTILHTLERLLDRRNEKPGEADTLLFYYGGHGKRNEFCTQRHGITKGKIQREPWIKHSEIIDLLERKFKGGTVWCIIDCCHSGGFGAKVADTKSLNVNYGCIMSVPPADEAGLEWSMSECFIRAFKGELLCFPGGKSSYYLSTKKGKHPIVKNSGKTDSSSSQATPENGAHPTWEQVIEYLADEMARIKGDRLTTLFYGKGMGTILKKPCVFGDSIDGTSANTFVSTEIRIPRDETWMDHFRRKCYAVNDGVYVKVGGSTSDPDGYHHIGWLPGRIISMQDSPVDATTNGNENGTASNLATTHIELYDVISKAHWTVTISGRNSIIGGLPFGLGFDPQPCVNAITRMARNLAYYDTSLPCGINVKVKWDDGKYYGAKTLSRIGVPWEEVEFDSSLKMIGPCVPLRWKDDDSISFVPTNACKVKDTKHNQRSKSKGREKATLAEMSTRDIAEGIHTPMDAMMASLAFDGKILGGLVTEEGVNSWEAWDAEDKVWSAVQLMNKVDPSILPLKVIAYHICYREAESLSIVYWESDSTLSLIPSSCLRQRSTTDDDSSSDEDSSDEESSDEATDHNDVRRYVAKTCYNLDGDGADPVNSTRTRRLELSTIAVA